MTLPHGVRNCWICGLAIWNCRKIPRLFILQVKGLKCVNILTNTNAFSIGTGILPFGYAGPEIISKPIIQYKDEIRLGWIKLSNTKLDDDMELFIENIKNIVSESIQKLN